jgi:hypothetical protein
VFIGTSDAMTSLTRLFAHTALMLHMQHGPLTASPVNA